MNVVKKSPNSCAIAAYNGSKSSFCNIWATPIELRTHVLTPPFRRAFGTINVITEVVKGRKREEIS
jgi:hypothetical protein